MSGQYSAGQFNDAFNPRRLGNWEERARDRVKLGARRAGVTQFIANERGHLLPHIPRFCCNPWGDFDPYGFDDLAPCPCAQHFRQHQVSTKLPKFFKPKRKVIQPPPPASSERPLGVKPAIDPILNRIRERRLPIVWIIGLPTQKIHQLRDRFCTELSTALNFAYINLDKVVQEWRTRQQLESAPLIVEEPNPAHKNQSFCFNPKTPKAPVTLKKLPETTVISVPARLSKSLTELVAEYDRTPNRAALAFASHVNAHRSKKMELKSQLENQDPHHRKDNSNRNENRNQNQHRKENWHRIQNPHRISDQITSQEQNPSNLIHFDLAQPFSRDKIMDLVKFAMIEQMSSPSSTTNGYIIDGIFLDQGDGVCFDKMFYSPAVCTYFTESSVNSLIDDYNRLRNSAKPLPQDVVTDKEIKRRVQLVPPKLVRRNKKYSFVEVDRLCRLFETKLIRVLNAEEANQETINFVYSLVYKHIKSYPNNPRSADAEDPFPAVLDVADNDFLSPLESPRVSHREAATAQDPVQEQMNKVVAAKLPVIWVLGFVQLATQDVRRNFCHLLGSQMNFAYINLDNEIIKWYRMVTPAGPRTSEEPKVQILRRASELARRIIDHNDILTAEEIVELVKVAMILARPTVEGYIIDQFPVNLAEATLFEQLVYPSTSLIYFLNVDWTASKSNEPPVEVPRYYRRLEGYVEQEVERVCDENGYKAIKVWNAEDLDQEGMLAIKSIIKECISTRHDDRGKADNKSRIGGTATCYDATPRGRRRSELMPAVPVAAAPRRPVILSAEESPRSPLHKKIAIEGMKSPIGCRSEESRRVSHPKKRLASRLDLLPDSEKCFAYQEATEDFEFGRCGGSGAPESLRSPVPAKKLSEDLKRQSEDLGSHAGDSREQLGGTKRHPEDLQRHQEVHIKHEEGPTRHLAALQEQSGHDLPQTLSNCELQQPCDELCIGKLSSKNVKWKPEKSCPSRSNHKSVGLRGSGDNIVKEVTKEPSSRIQGAGKAIVGDSSAGDCW